MKTAIATTCIVAAIACVLRAEEPDPSIAGLEQTAENFVIAYNARDAAALAALFTENGEITTLSGEETISGREDIQTHYEEMFADEDAKSLALEVASVRLVAPNLAIEDGTYHLSPPGDDDAPKQSVTYAAAMLKNDAGVWQIASTRGLKDVTDAAGNLADLANVLKGDWTCRTSDGVRMDLAFGWDPTGNHIAAEMLSTTSDGEPQPGSLRIHWDAAKNSIVSWIFDSRGGVTQGVWTATDEGWLVRSEGTTADGESYTATQNLIPENGNTLIWSAHDRVIDGESQPDVTLRIVRQAPEPEPVSALDPDTDSASH